MDNLSRIEHIKKGKPFKLADIIIFALTAVIVALSLGLLFSSEGKGVEVSINGELIASYPLTAERAEYRIDQKLTLIIEKGTAYVVDADCPDLTCESMGKISYVGQSIICAPNKIVITIVGEADYDVVVGAGR